jgi:hypothetical protein
LVAAVLVDGSCSVVPVALVTTVPLDRALHSGR